MSLIQSTAIPSSGGYEIDQSLRFNDDDSAYLSRTFGSPTNNKKYTYSAWVKHDAGLTTTGQQVLIGGGTSGSAFTMFYFNKGTSTRPGSLLFYDYDGTTDYGLETTILLRDPSAWYHLVLVYDSANATAADRIKIYVNGVRHSSINTDYGAIPLNYATGHINSTSPQYLGKYPGNTQYYDGYMAEVNFVDGQALTPSDFGETGDYGEWKPIAYSGSYGTNGFYLPFKQDYTVEGFSTVTYTGNSGTQYIGGTGFQPDFTWIKARSSSGYDNILQDAIRGSTYQLLSNTNGVEVNDTDAVTSFNSDGFSLAGDVTANNNAVSYVAWNWDMGGSNATNTAGSITSTVRANASYGQSIVSYTGISGAAQTIGHGLSSAPEMIFVKNRGLNDEWVVYNHSIGNEKYLRLDSTAALADEIYWNDTTPTDALFSVGNHRIVNSGSYTYIAYCFHSVTGYSKFGSYTGSGSAGKAITTGFKPAFVMIKQTNASGENWGIVDSTRNPTNPLNEALFADADAAASTSAIHNIDFNSNGFTIQNSHTTWNGSNSTYIYMAFADTREYAYWLDQSGNNNDWTSNNLTESDVMVDSPTNNFSTWNPLHIYSLSYIPTYKEGNLSANGSVRTYTGSSQSIVDGKCYAEFVLTTLGSGISGVGIRALESNSFVYYRTNGDAYNVNATVSSYGASYTTGDIIGVLVDVATGDVTFYKNGSSQGTLSASSIVGKTINFHTAHSGSLAANATWNANFGQDSSFAGNKTAQGNQDGNGIGDFYYAPPSGSLALCTKNLPDVAVVPSEHFNTVLYTGNGGTQSITGVGFQPDWIWTKSRNTTHGHSVFDAVRGGTLRLDSSSTQEERSNEGQIAFTSDGFNVTTTYPTINNNTSPLVAWNWKANGSGSSNTNGSINSTVSANVDAGFSIVSYTGTGANATFGHGLSIAPEMVIVKRRDAVANWFVYHEGIAVDAATDFLKLNTTGAAADYDLIWNDTAPTASVVSLGAEVETNASSGTFVSYCFHSVDGYSKVGSYTGNGSADGPFVHCGFRPAYVMYKNTDITSSWYIFDTSRSVDNIAEEALKAEGSGAEVTSAQLDILSNGFKIRLSNSVVNGSGNTIIFLAFAESPFKHSNAR